MNKWCPICRESKGEKEISRYLEQLNIPFIRQKRFDSCRDKKPLPFDFFLPALNTLIEFDGIQHNYKKSYYYSDTVVIHDSMKNKWAQKNNIKLVRIKSIDKVKRAIDNLKE
jgi:very-short-patch-repair endonuclease